MTARPGGSWILAAILTIAAIVVPPAAEAETALTPEQRIVALQTQLEATSQTLAAATERLKKVEAEVAEVAATARLTHDTLARELAQPVLLLVGDGKCPSGFERVRTDVLLQTGPRTVKNAALIDRAGLADEEQIGVGSRVYRYLDFCFRAAGTVTVR
jgi:hypothetical protein